MPKSPTKQQFNYLKALARLDYMFEGAMIPYILLRGTAQRMKNMLDLEEDIEIGITEKSLSKYSRRTLDTFLGEGWENKTHLVEGVPVNLKVIKRNYGFFKHLDTIPYSGGSFNIANPFDKYWKARSLVQ